MGTALAKGLRLGGLVLGGVLVALAIIEMGFRVHNFLHPSTAKGFFWTPKPEYGWGLAANRERPFYDDHGEFHTLVRINSLGLHDGEHRYTKPPGVFRILVLGDSYIEALQVDLEQGFGRLLRQQLQARAAPTVEVISAGVSSWGTDNELQYFRTEGYRYSPDLVLLSFTTSNDVRENYLPFNLEAAQPNTRKPEFFLNAAGALDMRPGPPPAPLPPWWQQLYVAEYLFVRLGGTILMPGSAQNGPPMPPDADAPHVPADMWVHMPKYRPEIEAAWQVTEALIRAVRDAATAHGARFAVMVHSGPWVHLEERWKFMLMKDPVATKTWDRRKPEQLVAAFLSREHIPFVDLYGAFEAAKEREQLFFKFDPHWTPAGHRVAAATVADFLLQQGLVPRRETDAP